MESIYIRTVSGERLTVYLNIETTTYREFIDSVIDAYLRHTGERISERQMRLIIPGEKE